MQIGAQAAPALSAQADETAPAQCRGRFDSRAGSGGAETGGCGRWMSLLWLRRS
jgi:hypothetical protein